MTTQAAIAPRQHANQAQPGAEQHEAAGQLGRLTPTEILVLKAIAEGKSIEQTAQALGRAVKTVEWHRASLGSKLGVANRVQLARIAVEEGLVPVRFRRTDELVLDGDRVQTAEAPGTGQQASAE